MEIENIDAFIDKDIIELYYEDVLESSEVDTISAVDYRCFCTPRLLPGAYSLSHSQTYEASCRSWCCRTLQMGGASYEHLLHFGGQWYRRYSAC